MVWERVMWWSHRYTYKIRRNYDLLSAWKSTCRYIIERKTPNNSPEGQFRNMQPCSMTRKGRGWSYIGI